MQAADRRAEVVAGAVIGGCRCRDDEPPFELEGKVASAGVYREQIHTFGPAELVVFSNDLTHEAEPVLCDIHKDDLTSEADCVNRQSRIIFFTFMWSVHCRAQQHAMWQPRAANSNLPRVLTVGWIRAPRMTEPLHHFHNKAKVTPNEADVDCLLSEFENTKVIDAVRRANPCFRGRSKKLRQQWKCFLYARPFGDLNWGKN